MPLVSRTFEIGLTVDMIIDLLVAWLLPAMGKKSLLAIIGASGKPEGTVQVDLSFMIGPPSSRYKGNRLSKFREILFLNMISALIVGETRN